MKTDKTVCVCGKEFDTGRDGLAHLFDYLEAVALGFADRDERHAIREKSVLTRWPF